MKMSFFFIEHPIRVRVLKKDPGFVFVFRHLPRERERKPDFSIFVLVFVSEKDRPKREGTDCCERAKRGAQTAERESALNAKTRRDSRARASLTQP